MRYPPEHKAQTRERILDAAATVFRREGYEGAGVDALAGEAGLTSGAFYGHFPSKEACLTEVVRRAARASESAREAGLEELEGGQWMAALLRRYLSEAHWAAIERGCPMPTLISELGRAGEAPKRAFAEAFGELIERIETRGPSGPEARRRALAAVAMAVGGMALARALGESDLSKELLDAASGFGVDRLLAGAEGDDGEGAGDGGAV